MDLKVSIPFKRETPSKRMMRTYRKPFGFTCFNSLQTGNSIQTIGSDWIKVALLFSFNSLQTGNSIQTRKKRNISISTERQFQFPSNGKLHPNGHSGVEDNGLGQRVSIPFKRETPSKQEESMRLDMYPGSCFNSLQTGNSIQTMSWVATSAY